MVADRHTDFAEVLLDEEVFESLARLVKTENAVNDRETTKGLMQLIVILQRADGRCAVATAPTSVAAYPLPLRTCSCCLHMLCPVAVVIYRIEQPAISDLTGFEEKVVRKAKLDFARFVQTPKVLRAQRVVEAA